MKNINFLKKMIERNILKEINRWLHEEKIILLKGARQVGKTTLIKKNQKRI
jgi:Archaeal ATPase.